MRPIKAEQFRAAIKKARNVLHVCCCPFRCLLAHTHNGLISILLMDAGWLQLRWMNARIAELNKNRLQEIRDKSNNLFRYSLEFCTAFSSSPSWMKRNVRAAAARQADDVSANNKKSPIYKRLLCDGAGGRSLSFFLAPVFVRYF